MPKLRTESFVGAGDFRWLRSDHGIWNGRTESLDVGAFTAGTHYPNGYIPSGTPCALVGTQLVPYDSTEATTTGAGVLAGHLFTDQPIVPGSTEDLNVPLLDHGRVNPAFVPVGVQAFVPPVAPLKRVSAQSIVYR
jgi:hypothetical protein